MKRKCGVLMPVASLPSQYGIGCFSKEAYEFVDFLSEAGQSYWQMLPLGQTGYGDSPYQAFSTFAGNPYFIDINELIEAGFIDREYADSLDFGKDPGKIDYKKIYDNRFPLILKAYKNSPYALELAAPWDDSKYDPDREAFEGFIEENRYWLEDYALFSAVKKQQNSRCYLEWPEDIRKREEDAIAEYKKKLADEIRCFEFQQYMFFRQWMALKEYANKKGIKIIGDIPIYVSSDSSDTWSHPELFMLDEEGFPTSVAGCPPDAFAATGQLWGNPIYRWDYHKETGYAWWISRMTMCFKLYDVVRIDHFRGFDEFYSIPAGDKTAENGSWIKGPGMDFINAIKNAIGDRDIIAEDLGFLTDSVRQMVKDSGFPSMKVLQFAFDTRGMDSDYLPHNYYRNCVVYTGTHDNETMRGWYESVDINDRHFAEDYCNVQSDDTAVRSFIKTALASVADTCIIPIQDYLDLGDEARINTPSTLGSNWLWRMEKGALSKDLAEYMRRQAEVYKRV